MSLRSEPPCFEIHCCEAPNVMRANWKTSCDTVRSVFDWLDKSVIQGTDEQSRIFVLTHPLPDRDADVTHAPQMKKCVQSMLRLLSVPAQFIHGNLDINSSSTSYLTFNTFYSQPIWKEK